jgi:hypothetical protein
MGELKIKRCQFCDPTNSDQILFWDDDKNLADDLRHHVGCLNCFAQGPKKSTKQLAIEAWNKRADDWISVETKLPEPAKFVILHWKQDGEIAIGVYGGDKTRFKWFSLKTNTRP